MSVNAAVASNSATIGSVLGKSVIGLTRRARPALWHARAVRPTVETPAFIQWISERQMGSVMQTGSSQSEHCRRERPLRNGWTIISSRARNQLQVDVAYQGRVQSHQGYLPVHMW